MDCAHELRPHNIACVSLWPGMVKTEQVSQVLDCGEEITVPETGVQVSSMQLQVMGSRQKYNEIH